MNNTNLNKYGLTALIEQEASLFDGLFLARISVQHRDMYRVISEQGELSAVMSGKLMHEMRACGGYPAVGDWVMVDRTDNSGGDAVIHRVLSRKSAFTRKAAGTSNAVQVIAANIDTVFLCMALNEDFNLRRMERYLTICWDSGATPVIILTKSDLCDNLPARVNDVTDISMGAEIIICSATDDISCSLVNSRIKAGETVAFVGSSGVGKSTLINRLIGSEILHTGEIRSSDGKGRHTTTHRQMLLLPNGGIVIDTPGMRELQLYSGNLTKTFEDIEDLAAGCKFNDCTHSNEPDCRVRQALEDGYLTAERFESYMKLQRELSYEGLDSRELEHQKINRMFNSMNEYKQTRDYFKRKNKR